MNCLVTGLSAYQAKGILHLGNLYMPCALGRSGRHVLKREGDGVTPVGSWQFMHAYYRADRITRPQTKLPLQPIRKNDGWCDAPGDRNYNRHVKLPYHVSAESLWRKDHLYDVVIILNHNQQPRIQGLGSAIFMHLARSGYTPTEGCVALNHSDLLLLLHKITSESLIHIQA